MRTATFRLPDFEQKLYNDVTRYDKNYYDQAKENRHVAFAMMIIQRRVTSSSEAILHSLERRQRKLEDLLHRAEKLREDEQLDVLRAAAEAELERVKGQGVETTLVKLRDWGYRVCVIHGGMDLDARIAAENTFQHGAQIMVATEAALCQRREELALASSLGLNLLQ